MRKINWVIIACILVSLVFWLSNPDVIINYMAFSGVNLLKYGRVWTLVTSLFLHADILHLASNMLFLYIFGNTIEKEAGTTKTLEVFFIGGILSFLLSLLFYDPVTPLIGASAAIFTLSAIVMLSKPLELSIIILPQGLIAIIYFVYNALALYAGAKGNVAYIAHIIGFAIGIPFGLVWSKNWLKNLLISIALLIVYIIIVSIVIPAILNAII